ncbi:MAG: dihydrofolate reductase [Nanoarchaeota archaeon]|nr:dihydrofolate reductase [Nanoarchaeota archaeon]
MNISAFMATSLDGFIARKDGSLDWLDHANALVPKGEDCGYSEFIEDIDVIVMGSRTFGKVLSFPEWPYGKRRLIVLSSKSLEIPKHLKGTVSCSRETPEALAKRLKAEGAKNIYVDGGLTFQSFLKAGLVHEFTVTIIPVLLGDGIRLFGGIPEDISLDLLSEKHYGFGFVQLRYAIQKPKQ